MQYPKYFINIETKWQSPLYLNPSVINYTDVMENICGLYYSNSINGYSTYYYGIQKMEVQEELQKLTAFWDKYNIPILDF